MTTAGTVWPDFEPTIRVPSWATGASVIATLSSIGQRDGAAQGQLTAVLNGTASGGVSGFRAADILYDLDAPAAGGSRHTLVVGGKWSDIRSIAGLTTTIRLEGKRINTASNPGYLVTVDGTQVIFDLIFTAQPVA